MNTRDRLRVGARRATHFSRRAALQLNEGVCGAIASNRILCAWIGPRIARLRPIGWYPGWSFAACEDTKTRLYWLREEMWERSKRLREPVSFEIDWHEGLRVRVFLGNDLSRCLFVAGSYEPNEFALLSHVLLEGMTVIDVGANAGLYTLLAARWVGSTGRVIALEPSAREFARLQTNLALNRLSNVIALCVGAHARPGHARLRIAEPGHEGLNTLGAFAYDIAELRGEQIELATLDRISSAQSLSRVDVVKIDAEGAEPMILEGARNLLDKFKPLLLIEIVESALRGQGGTRADIAERLCSLGYRFWIFGRTGQPEPAQAIEVDGCNIIAVHPERSDLMAAVAGAAAPPHQDGRSSSLKRRSGPG